MVIILGSYEQRLSVNIKNGLFIILMSSSVFIQLKTFSLLFLPLKLVGTFANFAFCVKPSFARQQPLHFGILVGTLKTNHLF